MVRLPTGRATICTHCVVNRISVVISQTMRARNSRSTRNSNGTIEFNLYPILDLIRESDVGQLLATGFEGLTLTPNIERLLGTHSVGTVLLSSRNLQGRSPSTDLQLCMPTYTQWLSRRLSGRAVDQCIATMRADVRFSPTSSHRYGSGSGHGEDAPFLKHAFENSISREPRSSIRTH